MRSLVSWLRSEGASLVGSQHAYGEGEKLLEAAHKMERLESLLTQAHYHLHQEGYLRLAHEIEAELGDRLTPSSTVSPPSPPSSSTPAS